MTGSLRRLPPAQKADAGLCGRPQKCRNDSRDRAGQRADSDFAEISRFLKNSCYSGRQILSKKPEMLVKWEKFAASSFMTVDNHI